MFQWILDVVPNILLGGSLLGMVVFSVTYARAADWRSTPAGRALMYLVLSMIAILTMAFAHLAWGADYALADFVRIGVYGAFAMSVWRLVGVLYDAQKLSFLSWLGLRKKHPRRRKEYSDV